MLVIVLIVTGIAGFCYYQFLSPAKLKALTADVLASYLGGDVEMDHASLSLRTYRLKLYKPRLLANGLPDETAEVFSAERVIIHLDREALWQGRVIPTQIFIDEPTVCLTQLDADGRLNFQHLRYVEPPDPEEVDFIPPRIEVRNGTFINCVVTEKGIETVGSLPFAGNFEALPDDPAVYRLKLYESEGTELKPGGLALAGRYDIHTDDVLMRVEQLQFTQKYQDLLPVFVGELWQMMAPDGRLPRVEFTHNLADGWETRVEVDGVAFDLPQLTDDPTRIRFQGVTGAFIFDADGVHIEDVLEGTVENLAYELKGAFNGYSPRSPFRLSLVTEDFIIPEEPTFIYALPKPVQEAFEVIRPSGTMRATLLISRNETDGQIDYEGLAKLVDAKCVLEAFPYPLTECRGQISFDRDEVKIRSFSAKTSGDGHALVYGRIWPPGPTANVDLVVTAVNIPFDETLFQAFDPDTRPIFDALFHTESYNHLRQRGHFISSHDFNAMDFRAGRIEDQLLQLEDDDPKRAELSEELKTLDRLLKTPAFDLGGLATVNVHVTRTEGEGDRTRAAAEIKIQEANIVYEEFPYPFHITEGIVRTQGTNITVEGFKLEGLAGGTGKIHGTVVERVRDNGEIGFKPEIFVAGYDLAINETLYDALPAEQAEWMRKLHLTGMLNLAGQVWRDDRGEPEMDMTVEILGASAGPGDGSLPLTEMHGQIRLTLNEMTIIGIDAKHPAGDVRIEGAGDWSDPDNETMRIHAALTNLRFEKPPFGALSDFADVDPAWTDFLDEHKIVGRFDCRADYMTRGDESHHTITIRPYDIAFLYADRKVVVDQMGGKMQVVGDQLRLSQFGGRIDGGSIHTSGTVDLVGDKAAHLSMKARGTHITQGLKNALPITVSDLLDTLEVEGQYVVDLQRVDLFPNATEGELASDVKGLVDVTEGSCSLGLDVTQFDGSFDITATDRVGRDMADLRVEMAGRSLQIAGRKVTELTGVLTSVPGTSQMVVPQLRGQMYGGVVGGRCTLDLDSRAYQMNLLASDVDLAQFIAADQPHDRPDSDRVEHVPTEPAMTGRLAAALDIQGRWDQPSALRGRGDIQIRQGVMYELPLAVGMLQMANLSLPLNQSFDAAQISYVVKDREILFERIRFDSNVLNSERGYISNVSLEGNGRMDLDSRRLELLLTSDNPQGIKLGPVSDMIKSFKDQFLAVRVTGTLDNPQTNVEQFSAVSEAWKDVFGKN